ncbi:hypothetical protein FOZ62_009269, partial [Perkinsus olseni]
MVMTLEDCEAKAGRARGPPRDPKAKKLYVATNALKRIIKDAKYYREEEDRLRDRRRERLQRGGDGAVLAADLKHMDDVIKETQAMGPVVHDQFIAAYKTLFSMLSDGSFPSDTTVPSQVEAEEPLSEEELQVLNARCELDNAEKILLAGNQEDLLREIQGEV